MPTLSRKQSLSLVLASSISTSKKTTAFLAFLAGLRLTGTAAGTGGAVAAPLTNFLPLASNARASISTVLPCTQFIPSCPHSFLGSIVTAHLSNVCYTNPRLRRGAALSCGNKSVCPSLFLLSVILSLSVIPSLLPCCFI